MTDFCGLPLTATAEVVDQWDAAVEEILGYRGDAGLMELVEQVPDLAIGHALLAALVDLGSEVDADAELAEAERRVAGGSERERAFVATTRAAHDSDRWTGPYPWETYLAEYPSDLVARFMVLLQSNFSFRTDVRAAAQRIGEEGLAANGRHPFVVSLLSMVAQERGDLDTADELAQEALGQRPGYVPAGHVRSHVFFESGAHDTGLAWLTNWVDTEIPEEFYYRPHLSWHAGLHELALDDRDAVLRRLREIAGSDASRYWLTSNGATYLWRCKLTGLVAADSDPSDGAIADGARGMVGEPPVLFAGWNGVVALGAVGDVATLRAVAAGGTTSTAPGVREVLPVLAGAVADLLEDQPERAADAMLRLRGDQYRLGGSRAQREVLEDTLLAALVRAGRTEAAARVLLERLDRRPSATDRRTLDLVSLPPVERRPATQLD
ncbi:MAG: hypothetical protein QOJ60_755 [Actinomycetota bacterium]|nr:hypothetical protein [Actinomycetota bacterium]